MLSAGLAGRLSGKGRVARYPTRKIARECPGSIRDFKLSSRLAEPRGGVFHAGSPRAFRLSTRIDSKEVIAPAAVELGKEAVTNSARREERTGQAQRP